MFRKRVWFFVLSSLAVVGIYIQNQTILFGRDDNQARIVLKETSRSTVKNLLHQVENSTFKAISASRWNLSQQSRAVPILKAKKLLFGPVYLFGAAAGNSTNSSQWDLIRVYGVYDMRKVKFLQLNLTCCLQFRTSTGLKTVRANVVNKWIFWARAKFRVFHIACENLRFHHKLPETISISPASNICDNKSSSYVKIQWPLREPGIKLAIGSQIAYGNISAINIIDWMETYRYLGVDKVVAYYYKLTNKEALKVLLYYHDNGFVDLYRYEPAGQVQWQFREPGMKLAIGSQIAYGNISAINIIDWMETYRYLGVDKVVAYYYKLTNKEALKVLLYYHDNGFVDLYRYEPAGQDILPRDFQQKGEQLFNDLQVVIKDSFERMSGYTYFGIIDLDEYLIPSRNRTLKELLSDLQGTYTDAAGFVFQSQYFFTSWGKSGNFTDLIFGQYVDRTADAPKIDNPKQIYMPQRISYGNIHTHRFEPEEGLKRVVAPAKEGYIRHYRQFRRRSNVTHMMNNVKRVRDTTLAQWSEKIEDRVHEVRKKLRIL